MSLFLMFRVHAMAGIIDKVFGSNWLYAAALLRLLLGAGLIASAATVAWPATIEVLGWLFVLGGLFLVVIPAKAVRRLAARFLGAMSPLLARLWLTLALLFGGFLIWVALA